MKIDKCTEISHMTLLVLSSDLPDSSWRNIFIDGKSYDPIPVMDIWASNALQ